MLLRSEVLAVKKTVDQVAEGSNYFCAGTSSMIGFESGKAGDEVGAKHDFECCESRAHLVLNGHNESEMVTLFRCDGRKRSERHVFLFILSRTKKKGGETKKTVGKPQAYKCVVLQNKTTKKKKGKNFAVCCIFKNLF